MTTVVKRISSHVVGYVSLSPSYSLLPPCPFHLYSIAIGENLANRIIVGEAMQREGKRVY